MEGRQERAEPLDRGHDLSSLSGEVEAVARGDRSMQQCLGPWFVGSWHGSPVRGWPVDGAGSEPGEGEVKACRPRARRDRC
jgi:hypothetical protein